MCMISIPASVMAADQNDLNPNIGRVLRWIARWSCSMTLFRYLTRRSSMSTPFSAWYASMAAVLAPLLSMLIFCGVPHWSMDLRKKRKAALRSRLAVNRKSIVWPALSTARYRYFHWPFTLTYVSSKRQLLPTARWRGRNATSRNGVYLSTQRLRLE